MRKTYKIPIFAGADIIAIVVVLFLAGLSFYFSSRSIAAVPDHVTVRVNGNISREYPLDIDKEYIVIGENGCSLILLIRDKGASVKNSSCSNKICEKTGRITGVGQSIVCLPGKISIVIECSSNNIDAVVG